MQVGRQDTGGYQRRRLRPHRPPSTGPPTLFHWYTSPSAKVTRSRPAAGAAGGKEAGRRVRCRPPARSARLARHLRHSALLLVDPLQAASPPPAGPRTLWPQLDGAAPELGLDVGVALVPPGPPLRDGRDHGGVVHHLRWGGARMRGQGADGGRLTERRRHRAEATAVLANLAGSAGSDVRRACRRRPPSPPGSGRPLCHQRHQTSGSNHS